MFRYPEPSGASLLLSFPQPFHNTPFPDTPKSKHRHKHGYQHKHRQDDHKGQDLETIFKKQDHMIQRIQDTPGEKASQHHAYRSGNNNIAEPFKNKRFT